MALSGGQKAQLVVRARDEGRRSMSCAGGCSVTTLAAARFRRSHVEWEVALYRWKLSACAS